jgi:hypothetical protein
MLDNGILLPAPLDYPIGLANRPHSIPNLVPYQFVPIGSWIKPYHTKLFDAHVKLNHDSNITPNGLVWSSPFIDVKTEWIAEWRVYVVNGTIVGYGQYDQFSDADIEPDLSQIEDWIACDWIDFKPVAYAMDVALTRDNRYVLVEINDGWALGYYKGTCSPMDYCRLLQARWSELLLDNNL